MAIAAAALFGGGATVGCTASTPPPTTATSASVGIDDAADGLLKHHRYHHHGGVTLFIAMSLDMLGVSPEQKSAVERIRTDLHARMDPARAAEQDLVALLADGLAAANIDAPRVDAALVRVAAAAAAAADATAGALNELHDVLTPPERSALVDKVESHWAVWLKANTEQAGATGPNDCLASLATDLSLTEDQVEKIRLTLGERTRAVPRLDPQEIAAHLSAFGEAFRSASFDAKGLSTSRSVNEHMAGWGAGHLANFVEATSLVLDPNQRAKFVQELREHASHDPSSRGNP